MGNILQKAIADWRRFSQSAFDLDLIITTPDGSETATIKGIGTRAMIPVETDGQEAIGELVHIGFSEPLLIEANPDYPIRNDDGLVSINNHRVNFNDSNGNLRTYIIKVVYPDSTVGMIMCDCADYKVVNEPTAPTELIISDIQANQFTATVTPPSNGQQTGYEWYISDDDGLTYTLAGTTDQDTPTFDYTGLTGVTEYYVKALATGNIDSEFSNIESATTTNAYEPESAAFFARNPTISEFEKEIVDAMVVRAKASGNISLLDEMFLPLKDGDPRIGFFSKTGVLFGGSSIDSNGFFDFDGVNGYLDTNFNPNVDSDDPDNYFTSFFCKEITNFANKNFGIRGATSFNLIEQLGTTSIRAYINLNAISTTKSGVVENNSTIAISLNSGNARIYVDGTPNSGNSASNNGFPNINFFDGARNNQGNPDNYINCIIGVRCFGEANGFDHVAHNEYTRLYIASLIDGTNVSDLTTANAIIDAA